MMNRHSNDISGFVNFPIDNPAFSNNLQGGMFVKLVVVDDFDTRDERSFAKCCGVSVADLKSECLVGDDRHAYPESKNFVNEGDLARCEIEERQWEARHFPNLHDTDDLGLERYMSRPYLAVVVMGSTGWSGWDVAKDENWICTYDDLSSEGQSLYSQVKALFPHATLHLLTFLDT